MSIQFDYQNDKITVNGIDIATLEGVPGGSVRIAPYGNITSTDLQSVVEELEDKAFVQAGIPTGIVKPGATWYETTTKTYYMYREVTGGSYDWVPIIVGDISPDSDTIDAGAF